MTPPTRTVVMEKLYEALRDLQLEPGCWCRQGVNGHTVGCHQAQAAEWLYRRMIADPEASSTRKPTLELPPSEPQS